MSKINTEHRTALPRLLWFSLYLLAFPWCVSHFTAVPKYRTKGNLRIKGLFPGDFLLYVSKYPDESCIKALQYDLQSLSYALSAPLFLSFGNHDVPLCKDNMLEEKNGI